MAKRATAKRDAGTPARNESAPAIGDTPSDGPSGLLVDEGASAEVLGFSPPQVSSSTEQANQPKNTTGLIDPPAESAPQVDTNQPTAIPPVDPATAGEGAGGDSEGKAPALPKTADVEVSPPEPHPAIELAKRHKVTAGKPRDGLPRYHTPPPFDVFAKKQKAKP